VQRNHSRGIHAPKLRVSSGCVKPAKPWQGISTVTAKAQPDRYSGEHRLRNLAPHVLSV
jgi:hypothetical protein